MRVLFLSLCVFLSGCGLWKHRAPPPKIDPNLPPAAQEKVDFDSIDVNEDGTVTKEEVEKYNEIIGKKDQSSYDSWSAAKWFFLIIILVCIACCGPWAGKKIKQKVDAWKSD